MRRREVILGTGAAALTLAGADYVWSVRDGGYADSVRESRLLQGPAPSPDFLHLVKAATLAANSHNTQPWLFSQSGSTIRIAPDFARRTPVVDPDDHHLFTSLGCASENLLIAAAAGGSSAGYGFDPAGDGAIRIDLGRGAASAGRDLFQAIPRRQSTRNIYDGRPVAAAALGQLASAARIGGSQLLLITERPKIEQVLELIVAANHAQVGDPAFVRELIGWIRFNGADAARHGDGLYSATSGSPVLPSWAGRLLFPRFFTAKTEDEKCIAQVRSSAGLAVFVADQADPEHWALTGRSFERFALQATVLGLKLAFLNQPVERAEFRPQLANVLGIPGRRPDLVVRFGYGTALPQSLRRPPGAVIHAGT